MANRRCLQTLTQHLHKSKPSFNHLRTLTLKTQIPNFTNSKPINPNPNTTNPILQNPCFSFSSFHSYRHFSSDRIDNDSESDDGSDDEDDETDYEDDDDGVVGGSGVKKVYTAEEKESEAANIGYKVIGQLQPSDRVFKDYEPVFAVIQVYI